MPESILQVRIYDRTILGAGGCTVGPITLCAVRDVFDRAQEQAWAKLLAERGPLGARRAFG